ncbi:MAG: excinuclease ABC subunit UvrC [Acidobacteria bacterium]|nr:excinuclease ABC subunit UvrC [Acidobacteriota bacterium]
MPHPRTPLEERARDLPEGPGVYLFRSDQGRILYIGKAKSLRERVRTYFQDPSGLAPRIRRMLAEARDLEVVLTGDEVEALVLENQMIKRERPRYNVLLRDDKNFPYLKLTWKDPFPRAILVRRAAPDGQLYFGPFLPARTARRTLRWIARLFQVATCRERLDGSRPRPCLYYHMRQCLGPCAGLVGEAEYRGAVRSARLFLEGRTGTLRAELNREMRAAAEREEFEAAARLRDLLRVIERQPERAGIGGVGLEDQDFFAAFRRGDRAVLLVYLVRNGEVRSRREFRFDGLEAGDAEFLGAALAQFYAAAAEVPGGVRVDGPVADGDWIERWLTARRGRRVRLSWPRRGPLRRFLITMRRNARLAFETALPEGAGEEPAAEAWQERLGLDAPPHRIEGFDISHTGGGQTAASVVVWEGGTPVRAAFRRMRLRTLSGPDDTAAMAEAVGRRYARLMREGGPLPDLILLDGGRGQLEAARGALAESGVPPVPLAAIAKAEEKIYLPDRPDPVSLPLDSPVLHLIQRIRDEAHRHAHAYHSRLRGRTLLHSELLEVPGIGPARARGLLRRFGSLREVIAAGREALREEVGALLADRIREHFRKAGE